MQRLWPTQFGTCAWTLTPKLTLGQMGYGTKIFSLETWPQPSIHTTPVREPYSAQGREHGAGPCPPHPRSAPTLSTALQTMEVSSHLPGGVVQ